MQREARSGRNEKRMGGVRGVSLYGLVVEREEDEERR